MKKSTIFSLLFLIVSVFTSAQDGPSSYYQNNPTLGKRVTNGSITIDGNPQEWSSEMLICQGVANDDAKAFKGAHEQPVLDLYQLYAAWDDNNLYLMWQYTNVGDIASPEQDLAVDNAKPYNADMPIRIAFDIDPSTGTNGMMTGATDQNDPNSYVWEKFSLFPNNNVDKMIMCSTKPTNGVPGLFHINPSSGSFDYSNVTPFKNVGGEYMYGDYCVPTEIWGIPQDEHIYIGHPSAENQFRFLPEHLADESFYVNFLNYKTPNGRAHDKTLETVYEMKVPLDALGIDANYLENQGIGIMLISIYGISGVDSLPYDETTKDNATGTYSQDDSTSKEKEDLDIFTAPFARIGKEAGDVVVRPTIDVTPKGGKYIGGVDVTLSTTGENTPINIYYTLDGTNPTTSSASVNSGSSIRINANTTLKAMAVDSEGTSSVVSTQTYVTEEQQIPDGGISVSFKKPSDWGTVKLWAWNASVDLFPSWPGVDMVEKENGWYSYAFDESITTINVIFSNGSGYQSEDIENVTATTCYEKGSDVNNKFKATEVDCPSTTSIDETSVTNLYVYPNPATEAITVVGATGSTIKIVNVAGTLVKSIENYQGNAIDISTLPSGIYLVQIEDTNNNKKIAKVVKP